MFPIESDIYAVAAHRVWWAPWRWSLSAWRWSPNYFSIEDPARVAVNISKAECIGLMKILGYTNEIKC